MLTFNYSNKKQTMFIYISYKIYIYFLNLINPIFCVVGSVCQTAAGGSHGQTEM